MHLRIYFSVVPQSRYSDGEQQIVYLDACNANGGGGSQVLNFLWKGKVRKEWRNQGQDVGTAGPCLPAESRSSATNTSGAGVGRRMAMPEIWTGCRFLNQPHSLIQRELRL